MLRVVPPCVPTADIVSIAAADVGIAVEIVIPVDIDVVVAPTAAPAPAASPRRANCDSNTK